MSKKYAITHFGATCGNSSRMASAACRTTPQTIQNVVRQSNVMVTHVPNRTPRISEMICPAMTIATALPHFAGTARVEAWGRPPVRTGMSPTRLRSVRSASGCTRKRIRRPRFQRQAVAANRTTISCVLSSRAVSSATATTLINKREHRHQLSGNRRRHMQRRRS